MRGIVVTGIKKVSLVNLAIIAKKKEIKAESER